MSLPTNIPALREKKEEIHKTFSKADAALALGTISAEEHRLFLIHTYGTTQEKDAISHVEQEIVRIKEKTTPSALRSPLILIGCFCLLMFSLFSFLFWSIGGITGAVTLDSVHNLNTTFTQSTSQSITVNDTTRITATGSASGVGDASLIMNLDGQKYVLYTYNGAGAKTPHASLQKRTYELGESIAIAAENVSSAYLMTADAALPIDHWTTLDNLTVGNYTLTLLINDSNLSRELLSFAVVPQGYQALPELFDTCGEACHLNFTGTATLEITTSENASITIEKITFSSRQNSAPVQIAQIPDTTGVGTVTIPLENIFVDSDEDTLFYDTTTHDGVESVVENNTLIINGTAGTYTYYVYASDLKELTQSNAFTVTLTAPPIEDTNSTNSTEVPVNTTEENNTENITAPVEILPENNTQENNTGNLTAPDCNNADPNKRDLDCLNTNGSKYFQEDIFWENTDRASVARITPIGNLLITGKPIKNDATNTPGSRDFTIGYKDSDFNYIPTIWIDVAGNLHLRGTLYEENANLVPPAGSYAVLNRRGIYLAYADPNTGDLYLRGNVIPYRESIYE